MLCVLGAACLAVGVLAGPAAAEERKLTYSFTVTGASDYLFRGVSYTGSDPTVNTYSELDYGIAYLAFWNSNIDTAEGGLGPWEQDIYAGIRPVTGPINWDLAAWWYIYGNKSATHGVWDTDYVEFKVGATTSPIKDLTLGLTGYYAPDQGFATPTEKTIEGSISYNLPKMGIFSPTLSAALGYWKIDTNSDYPTDYFVKDDTTTQDHVTYWNAGVKLAVDKFFMDLRYWDTDYEARNADARFLFSAGVNLLP
jgi:uncharacterized protein (TIGR02001 family)